MEQCEDGPILHKPPRLERENQEREIDEEQSEFVARRGLGIVVSSWRGIPAAVAGLARDPARREAMRASLDALPPNRAVYEVLDLLGRALRSSSQH